MPKKHNLEKTFY